MRSGLLIPAIVALAAALGAAECVPVEGDRIRAADLARANRLFEALDPGLFIAYSPIPGAERVLSSAQLRRLARRHGLPEAGLSSVCFVRAAEPLSAGRVLAALRTALQLPEAHLELVDFSRKPVPRGQLRFKRSGLTPPPRDAPGTAVLWRGSVSYGSRHTMPIWARVRISVSRRQVVAVEDLRAGRPIPAAAVTEQVVEAFPEPTPPLAAATLAVGAVPRRTIAAGEAVYAADLRLPNDVKRGDAVDVEVSCGGALLRFRAKAETGGRRGQKVLVRNPVNGRRFAALVEDKGKVSVRLGVAREGS